jgi:hypothetical protein
MNESQQKRILKLEQQIADIKAESEDVYSINSKSLGIFKNGKHIPNSEIVKELNDYHNKSKSKWIEWNGGECPVEDNAYVKIKFRNKNTDRGEASKWHGWKHDNFGGGTWDIIAYMVID